MTLSTPNLPPTISDTASASHELIVDPTRQPEPINTPTPKKTTPNNIKVLLPEYVLHYQQLKVAPTLPADATLSGTLIIMGYGSDTSYFINFTKDRMQEIPKDRYCYSTSPDGKWAVYCQGNNPSARDWLIVESVDGKEINKLPINQNWIFGNPIWLDNQQLVFNKWTDKEGPSSSILPVEVVNLFTGKRQELASDYPDLRPSGLGPSGSAMDFLVSTVVYHPSLNLVVYPKRTPDGFYIVLWDRKAQHALVSVESLGGFSHTPLWSPDGKQFIVAVIPQGGKRANDFSEYINEWFSVSLDGQVQQLTHFEDYFSHTNIGRGNWSPDGQRVAFFMTTRPTICDEGEQLAVLEMKTRQVTNYCIPGVIGIDGPPPIWSPDSRYIAFNGFVSGGYHVVVVDIEQEWAAQIAGDLYPKGWLAGP